MNQTHERGIDNGCFFAVVCCDGKTAQFEKRIPDLAAKIGDEPLHKQ